MIFGGVTFIHTVEKKVKLDIEWMMAHTTTRKISFHFEL